VHLGNAAWLRNQHAPQVRLHSSQHLHRHGGPQGAKCKCNLLRPSLWAAASAPTALNCM
jgi:hypothetical protein